MDSHRGEAKNPWLRRSFPLHSTSKSPNSGAKLSLTAKHERLGGMESSIKLHKMLR